MKRFIYAALAAIFTGLAAPSATAATIHWGNAILATLVKSNGTPIVSSDNFTFELGVFADDFVPTPLNTATWMEKWKRLDDAPFSEPASYFTSTFQLVPDPGGATSGGQPLSISTSPETSNFQVEEGSQMYIMVYNNTAMDETTELFLGTALTWTIPPASDTQLDKPFNYRVSGITQPIYGGANNTFGSGTVYTPTGSYQLQTATFPPIPEPSALGLLGLVTAGAMLQRRRLYPPLNR